MFTPHPLRRRALAAMLALAVVFAGCSGEDDGEEARTDPSPDPTAAETTSTEVDATTTSASEAPRALDEEQLLAVLLQPEDVPGHLAALDEDVPPAWQETDPPACGELLAGEGPGAVRVATMFAGTDGFLAYESFAEHTPGTPEDLDPMRDALAGPCAEGFAHVTADGIDTFQRTTLLSDLDLGDDAFAARFDIDSTAEGYAVEHWSYMIYFRRGDVSIQVQAITGAVPSADLAGPEITLEEVELLARRLDDRLAAL